MADVYRQWSQQGASFHYVSSSPWQLFESLHRMNVMNQFPAGTMHLRNFRLRDQLLKKVIIRRHGKTTAIRFLMKHLPERKFVLIGDSGEKDPEIYRKICRKFPGRVRALLIRDIPERPLEEERSRKLEEAIPEADISEVPLCRRAADGHPRSLLNASLRRKALDDARLALARITRFGHIYGLKRIEWESRLTRCQM